MAASPGSPFSTTAAATHRRNASTGYSKGRDSTQMRGVAGETSRRAAAGGEVGPGERLLGLGGQTGPRPEVLLGGIDQGAIDVPDDRRSVILELYGLVPVEVQRRL